MSSPFGYDSRRHVDFLYLGLPLALYLIPLVLGYSWNSLGGLNVLNPPEGYSGRAPHTPITVENWGSSVVVIPFHARLGQYLLDGDAPLWNPYQGLGQPFAAQGDGNPYFPAAIMRALLPYSLSNWTNVGMIYLAGVFLYLFLYDIGLSRSSSLFGAVAFMTSGALSLHLARDNLLDQIALMPMLFWAVGSAVKSLKMHRFALLVLVTGLHTIGGFIPIALVSTMTAVVFGVVYAWRTAPTQRAAVAAALGVALAAIVGLGLAGFSLLPTLVATVTTLSQNLRTIFYRDPIPLGNGVAFFLPLLFGHPGSPPWVIPRSLPQPPGSAVPISWGDLFAFAGLVPLLLALGGFSVASWRQPGQRTVFLFSMVAAALWMARYLGIPPFDMIDLVPPFSQHTKKHVNGLIVLLLVIAASTSLEHVREWRPRRAVFIIAIALSLLFLLAARATLLFTRSTTEALAELVTQGAPHVIITTVIALVVVAGIFLIVHLRKSKRADPATFACFLVVGEMAMYVPLGFDAIWAMYTRIGVLLAITAAGTLLIFWQRNVAYLCVVGATLLYGWLVVAPPQGLPERFESDRPPSFMQWLKPQVGDDYRTLGILPDFSSIAMIQDPAVVGPLTLLEHWTLVQATGSETLVQAYRKTPYFAFAGLDVFSLTMRRYVETRPIYDWLGIRYVVFDHTFFGPGRLYGDEYLRLLDDQPSMSLAYEDARVTIAESSTARSKVEVWYWVSVLDNREAIADVLRCQPSLVLREAMIERGMADTLVAAGIPTVPAEHAQAGQVMVDEYRPNYIRASLDMDAVGIAVIKDAYAPGWHAYLDGQPTTILRVNGMVRGVVVPHAGHHSLELRYDAPGFGVGLWLSSAILLATLICVLFAIVRPTNMLPQVSLAVGFILGVVTLLLVLHAVSGGGPEGRAYLVDVATARAHLDAQTSTEDARQVATSNTAVNVTRCPSL